MNKHRSPLLGTYTSYFIGLTLLGLMIPGLHFLFIHNNSEVEAKETETATSTTAVELTTEEEIIEDYSFSNTTLSMTFHYPIEVENKIAEIKRQEYIASEEYIPSIDRIKKEEVQLREEEETKEFVVASTTRTGSPVATSSVEDDITTDYTYYATYSLTAYCATGNPCADGAYPQVGHTVASNDRNLWHKWIYIEGMGTYYVHDTGGMATNVIDVFMGSYNECIQFGRRSANIYVYN